VKFVFKTYGFDAARGEARFVYGFEDGREFVETVNFGGAAAVEGFSLAEWEVFDRALFLAFILAGTSYWKAFPTTEVVVPRYIDEWQAEFFSRVYQEGMSQFANENGLGRGDLARFKADGARVELAEEDMRFEAAGILAMESGGKDSLLMTELLERAGRDYTAWYLSGGEGYYPKVLEKLKGELVVATRRIDRMGLEKATAEGGLNGHVPVSYINMALAVVQAILLRKSEVVAGIGREGGEAHAQIGDLAVNHQWSKSWAAEEMLARYVREYITPDVRVGSPLRGLTELYIAELFSRFCWGRFGREFSSCNVANYRQGADNARLTWCGKCPKCANAYLLFAPFVGAGELQGLFGGRDLFRDAELETVFKGLLGVEGVMKPLECVGEVAELRWGYGMVDFGAGYGRLGFGVPGAEFDYRARGAGQDWALGLTAGGV
jgi:hypothetical protein